MRVKLFLVVACVIILSTLAYAAPVKLTFESAQGTPPGASGTAQINCKTSGEASVMVKVSNLDMGTFDVAFMNEGQTPVVIGTLNIEHNGRGVVRIETTPCPMGQYSELAVMSGQTPILLATTPQQP